jgi:hypothetical protein
MRSIPAVVLLATALAAPAHAQTLDKELVATLSGPNTDRAVVSELLWDGGTLIIQSATIQPDGQLMPHYFAAPGPHMELRHLAGAPESVDHYWKMKASRTSPTGLGTITEHSDSKLPMYGVGNLEDRVLNAVEMGGTETTYDLRLGRLTLHSRRGLPPPYDGEVWAWSAPALNRIAYVDGKGNLWIARADGTDADRVMRGSFTLPAWSDDGRLIAVAERKDDGARWDVSIVRVPEQFRK